MKPYQFYTFKRFPKLNPGQSVSTHVQFTFSGEDEDVETKLSLERLNFEDNLSLLRVKSEIRHSTYGFIKRVVNNERQRVDFTEYLEPVDFPAFHDPKRGVVIFQAPKKACRGVLFNLRTNSDKIKLVEMVVEFGKLIGECSQFFGAWFRGVSSRVRAAGISGDQIQDDSLFQQLLREGQLSNVTIPWVLNGAEHRVMITSGGAVVLVHDYRDNQGLELQIVCDVHDRLLTKVWEPKATDRPEVEIPAEP